MTRPRVSFGMIVFNGEPFILYNLRALYPFAHQILVVEGACLSSKRIATSDGHSTDGTLEALYKFKKEEDIENKLEIIVKDGFWKEKDEQSQAYAERATGDYLWQIDVDEFYQPDDMAAILQLFENDPTISGASIKQITFWGGFDYLTDGFYLRNGEALFRRIFRWGPGYSYITHRPPTVYNAAGKDLFTLHWLNGEELAARGILLYHYSLLFPKQVIEKCEYYATAGWAERPHARDWAQEVYLNLKKPFRVHNVYDYLSWLEFFKGQHPSQINALRKDIHEGKVKLELRQTQDIEKLLRSPIYRAERSMLIFSEGIRKRYQPFWSRQIYRLKHPIASFKSLLRKTHHKIRSSQKGF